MATDWEKLASAIDAGSAGGARPAAVPVPATLWSMIADYRSDPEIRQDRLTRVGDEDVVWLDITMDHAMRVGLMQPLGNLGDDADAPFHAARV